MGIGRKSSQYQRKGYTGPRPDVLKLIPEHPDKVLDVGCGAGALGASIKDLWKDILVVGVDKDPLLLEVARTHLDKVLRCDLNGKEPFSVLDSGENFDVILFADVLEHLVEPETVLVEARSRLAPGGCIITSLPNVRHYSTFISLGIGGRWPQRERGIHDKTHLHFFARRDILSLFEVCGLKPVLEHRNVRLVESWSWTNIPGKFLDFWPFRSFLTFQYLHRLVPHKD